VGGGDHRKRVKRATAMLAAAWLTAASGAGIAARPPSKPAASAGAGQRLLRLVTDDTGRRVRVRYPPLRIASLAPGATAMLFAAGAGGQVVATVNYSDEPAAARRVPRVGSFDAIDMERLIGARPDVAVVWPDGVDPAELEQLERLGIPVYRQQARTFAAMTGSLRRLGRLAGTSAIADRRAAAMQSRIASLRRRYGRLGRRPSVLLEVWNRPLYTVGGRELMSDALRVCGARNVFGDLPQDGPAIDLGAVLARNPDIIVAVAPDGRGADWLAEWRRFRSLSAVRHGRLIDFEDRRLTRLGPGAVAATAELCRRIAAVW
jgi:iron complex transport system substrate-binding protein